MRAEAELVVAAEIGGAAGATIGRGAVTIGDGSEITGVGPAGEVDDDAGLGAVGVAEAVGLGATAGGGETDCGAGVTDGWEEGPRFAEFELVAAVLGSA